MCYGEFVIRENENKQEVNKTLVRSRKKLKLTYDIAEESILTLEVVKKTRVLTW